MILTGTGKSGAMEQLAPKALEGDWKPGFMVKHFIKDIGLALQEAEEYEIALPGADTAYALYDMLDAIGGAELGTQAITLLYAEEADAAAAGLDWSRYTQDEDACGCGHDHEHGHGEEHECCHGHGHEHGGDHECCHGEGHHHGHGDGHECGCRHHGE